MTAALRLFTGFFLLTAACTGARAETVVLAADEWCPINCEPDSDRPGYMIEIARLALAREGHKVDYVVMPWSRALEEAKAGRIDGAVGASVEEYPTGLFPRSDLGHNVNALAMTPERAKGFAYKDVESLKPLRIGGARGYAYDGGPIDAYFASEAAKGKVELLSGNEVQTQNLRKLLAGRIDAMIDNEQVLRYGLGQIEPKPDLALAPVGDVSRISIGFTAAKPSSARYAELIDETVKELRASGELKTILGRYNLTDWGP